MRDNDGLTLKEFEAITGICYSLTSQYENRKRKVSPKHREIIITFIVGEYMEAVNLLNRKRKQE